MTRPSLHRMAGSLALLAALHLLLASVSLAAPLKATPQMALGFDDAPTTATPLVLSALQTKGVKATFFVVGEEAEAYPAQARQIAAAGMLIGNHSYDHPHFATATADFIYQNLSHAQSAIASATGVTPHWYRSPFLDWNDAYNTVLPELGLKASWPTINPKDWAGTPSQDIINLVVAQAAPGGVVELHDMVDQTNTIDALPGLIHGLHAAGYDLVTLDDIGLCAIEGHVSDIGGPILGATVTAYDSHGNVVKTASTDATGWYRLARMSAGTYRVGFVSAGHGPAYYSGASDLAHAQGIAASADYTMEGADATLTVADTTPPVTTISAVPSVWVNHDVAFSLTASDSGSPSGIARFYGLNAPAVTAYATTVTVSAQGTTTISYRSIDTAGNAEATKTATVRIDKTAPLTTDDHVSTYTANATVHLAASDPLSGVAVTRWTLDGAPHTGLVVSTTAAGAHTLRYASTDVAGNTETSHTVGFTVLASPVTVYPTTLTLAGANSATAGRTYRLSGSITPSTAGGRIKITVQRWTGGAWRQTNLSSVTIAGGRFVYSFAPGYKGSWRIWTGYDGRTTPTSVYEPSLAKKAFTVK